MRGYFGLGQLSSEEKSDILDQHRSLYNGYQTMQPQVSNTQPLTVYDFAGDKEGMVVNNKGEVKKYTNMGINEQVDNSRGSMKMSKGEHMEYGHKSKLSKRKKGHLDDIYKVNDLNLKNGDFDYVEGGGNDFNTFEGMFKNLRKEDELDEQGGNVNDMNVSYVEPAYDFDSNGPMAGGDSYPVNEYETMESAWSDEIEEVDISGSQGVYGDMKPAFDFDSEGPGKAGPYQEFSYESETDEQFSPKNFDSDEFDPTNYEDLDPKNSSWEEIKSYFGDTDWSEIDEDLQDSFHNQKNKIIEMFNRFKRYGN